MYNYKNKVGILVLVWSVLSFAMKETPKLKISGWGYLTYGKIVSSPTQSGVKDFALDGQFYSDFDAGLSTVVNLSDNWRGRFHFGLTTAFMMVDNEAKNVEMKRRRFVPYIIDAAIEYKRQFNSSTFLTEFGYFPVKYNREARNLGEYLFRSNCYPNVVVNGFELADKEKVVGLHGMYQNDFTEESWLRGDLFFQTELNNYPLYNFSLSYMLSANFIKFIEVGAGISHQHLIPVDKMKTTPGDDRKQYNRTIEQDFNKVGVIGPDDDTVIYTFRGIKAMGRITLDPKALFNAPIFGCEDLKIYSEVAILGLKDYDYWYDNRLERMPLLVGFNFPTFKLLDVLAIEMQYWKYPWSNNAENIWRNRSPLPYMTFVEKPDIPNYSMADTMRVHEDDLKWSIYASKKIKNRVRLSLQFACDNMSRTIFSGPPPSFAKYTEIMPRKKDWYWSSRIQFYF